MAGGPNIPTPTRALLSTWPTAAAPLTPASAALMLTAFEKKQKFKSHKRACNLSIVWKSSATYFCRTNQRG